MRALEFYHEISGLEDVLVTKMEQLEVRVALHVELEVRAHRCPRCQEKTRRVYDYRTEKIKYLKWFERLTYIFYKKRRYACGACGKKFAEQNSFIARYQRFSKEWNQAVHVRSVKAKKFKEVAAQYCAFSSTILRRFDVILLQEIPEVKNCPVSLPSMNTKAITGKASIS